MTAAIRDRGIVLASLAAIAGLAWLYLYTLSNGMSGMDDMPGMAMPMASAPASFWLATMMWAVMMVGMMLPSAMPMILLFTKVQGRQGKQPILASAVFICGYVLIWAGFSVAAAGLQSELAAMAFLSPSLALANGRVAGAVLLLAAAYEFSPVKRRCLTRCSSPFGFITSHWRPGLTGAFRMGMSHGAFCVGCCWALMLLLFVVGVMNLLWVALISILILLQKVTPYPRAAAGITGSVIGVVGLVLLLQ